MSIIDQIKGINQAIEDLHVQIDRLSHQEVELNERRQKLAFEYMIETKALGKCKWELHLHNYRSEKQISLLSDVDEFDSEIADILNRGWHHYSVDIQAGIKLMFNDNSLELAFSDLVIIKKFLVDHGINNIVRLSIDKQLREAESDVKTINELLSYLK